MDKCLICVFTNGFETLKNILAFLHMAINGHDFIFANLDFMEVFFSSNWPISRVRCSWTLKDLFPGTCAAALKF